MDLVLREVFLLSKHDEKTIKLRTKTPSFNYVTLEVRSDLCLKGFLVLEDAAHEFLYQPFYLEPGTRPVSFFINGRETSCDVAEVNGIVIQNLENKMGRVELSGLTLSTRAPYAGRYLLEDGDTCAGFDSAFGPVLSFVTSKNYEITEAGSPRPRISFSPVPPADPAKNCNLINTYDNGRFPQQSWYGTRRPPYRAGLYKETVWVFNPVQTGDGYGNLSRIADFRADENAVYFKIIPLDWSKRDEPLDCYMEAEYSLEGGCLKVRNRFVDFSLLHHGGEPILQELPTFNTIASLDRFCYIPAGHRLANEPELDFWGEGEVAEQQIFRTKTCWSCWLNRENFGVGLFTPYVDEHLAGKYRSSAPYETPSARAEVVNYLAAVARFGLESLRPVEYTYYLSVGSFREIADRFRLLKVKKNPFLQSLRAYHDGPRPSFLGLQQRGYPM